MGLHAMRVVLSGVACTRAVTWSYMLGAVLNVTPDRRRVARGYAGADAGPTGRLEAVPA
jgi:hypothetical protein